MDKKYPVHYSSVEYFSLHTYNSKIILSKQALFRIKTKFGMTMEIKPNICVEKNNLRCYEKTMPFTFDKIKCEFVLVLREFTNTFMLD